MAGRILVIRGGAIGDFILTLPAIALVREGFPGCHLEVMAYRRVLPLVERRYYADSVRSIEYAQMAACFNPKATMNPEMAEYFLNFGQIISFLYDPDQLFESSLRAAGVRNFLSISPHPADGTHASRHLAGPLASLALFLEEEAARFFPSEEDHQLARKELRQLNSPWVAIHPGSGSRKKNWPVENWAKVIRSLLDHLGAGRVGIIGGEADEAVLGFLREEFGTQVTFLQDLPLNVLGAALGRAALFLGHDSGISHLAAASGARCLLLFGPTDPGIWAPKGPLVEVLVAGDRRLENLLPREVIERAMSALP